MVEKNSRYTTQLFEINTKDEMNVPEMMSGAEQTASTKTDFTSNSTCHVASAIVLVIRYFPTYHFVSIRLIYSLQVM